MDKEKIYFIPRITKHDFSKFKALLKEELPASTFNEWINHTSKKIQLWSTQGLVVEIDVNPDKFSGFCIANNKAYNARSLQNFADLIGNKIEN